jgi:hypothetical protein
MNKPAASERKWLKYLIDILLVISAVISTYISVVEHRDHIQEKVAREAAERRSETAEQKAAALEKRIQDERDTMEQFRVEYNRYLSDLRIAVSKYKEVPNTENRDNLVSVGNAFVSFVKRWRQLQDALAKSLDGNVDELGVALNSREIGKITTTLNTIQEASPSQLLILETSLKRIKEQPAPQK